MRASYHLHEHPVLSLADPTLNRLVLRKLGRVPRAGERFKLGSFNVTVEKVRGASVELMTFKRAA